MVHIQGRDPIIVGHQEAQGAGLPQSDPVVSGIKAPVQQSPVTSCTHSTMFAKVSTPIPPLVTM